MKRTIWLSHSSRAVVAAAVLSLLPAAVQAQTPTFGAATKLSTGAAPLGLGLGDVNNDSHIDVVVAEGNSSIGVFLGNGDGTFQTRSAIADANFPWALALGDLNGDGNLDIANTRTIGAGMSVRLENGDGTFQSPVVYPVGSIPEAVALADFNGDSVLDAVTANRASDNVSVRLGNGDGTFQSAAHYSVGTAPTYLTVIDVENNGALDLAVTNSLSDTISILPGNGDGTFGTAASYATGIAPNGITNTDLDNNGFDDLVTAAASASSLSVHFSDGAGGFNSPSSHSAGSMPRGMASADLNADTFRDVVVTNSSAANLQVFSGDGAGSLSSVGTFDTQSDPRYVKAVDVNEDGLPDLIASNAQSSSVSVLLNTTSVEEIDVQGNSTSIANGDSSPSSSDNTDFGNTLVGGSVDKTFTVLNIGAATLDLTGSPRVTLSGTHAADFFVAALPSATVTASSSTTFQIRFSPSATGTRTATVTITNTDPNEGTYTFTIQGTGVVPPNPPTISSTSPASPANDNSPKVIGTSDVGTTVNLYNNSSCTGTPLARGTATEFASPWLTITVSDNTMTTVYASATDQQSNVSTCSGTSVNFTEVTPAITPNTQITRKPSRTVKLKRGKRNVQFRFTSVPSGATFECKLDGRAWQSCTSPQRYTIRSRGRHTFRARATLNGVTDPTAATWTLKARR